jgi:hypothetical protein
MVAVSTCNEPSSSFTPVIVTAEPTLMSVIRGRTPLSDDPDRIARPAVPDLKLETCAIVRRRHSEDRGRDRDLPLLLGIAAR